MFYFHPYLGEWSNWTDIFQMGWNHQLDMTDGDVVGIHCLGVVLPSQKGSSILNFNIGKKSFMVACWCNSWRSWSKVKINMLAKWRSWWAVAFKLFLGGNKKHPNWHSYIVVQTLFSFRKENLQSKTPILPIHPTIGLMKMMSISRVKPFRIGHRWSWTPLWVNWFARCEHRGHMCGARTTDCSKDISWAAPICRWIGYHRFSLALSILNSQNWLFWGPVHPCYTGSFALPLKGPMILNPTSANLTLHPWKLTSKPPFWGSMFITVVCLFKVFYSN